MKCQHFFKETVSKLLLQPNDHISSRFKRLVDRGKMPLPLTKMEKSDVLNTRPLKELQKLLKQTMST
jgi:hypothetical protein